MPLTPAPVDLLDAIAARIARTSGTVEIAIYDDVTHQTLIGAFAAPLRLTAPMPDDVAGFIRRHIHTGPEDVRTPSGQMA